MALKQEAAGLTTEAANNYYIALMKNRNNIEAQIGMKKTGQLVLNQMLNDFARDRNFGSKKEAVYNFQKARDYRDKIQGVGIRLELADFYLSDYENVKSDYLKQLYDEGALLLEEQKFQEAELKFKEIKTLEPNYKDTRDLADIAFMEPLYNAGVSAMKAEHYREAYASFEKVVARRSDYKDAKKLMSQSLEKGTYTIALLPFVNSTSTSGLDAKVSAYTLEALTNINDPFLRIVDREHMQAILQEQKLQLSGVVDDKTAVNVGQLVGAQAILTGTVLNYSTRQGQLRTSNREAYEAFRVKKLNNEDGKYYFETRYKPVTFTEYSNSSSCNVSFQFKLIDLKTGELIKTDILEKSITDEVRYGRYDGDVNELFPSNGSNVNFNQQDRRSLIGLFNARQELRPAGELSNELFNHISKQMSNDIGATVKQIVK